MRLTGSLLLLALLWPAPIATARDAPPTRKIFRFMTFNIHHGEGVDGKVDLDRIAQLIKTEQADIVALQEVDKGAARTQQIDMPAQLAELTGLSCVFSNNFHHDGGEYGNAILTRYPVRSSTNTHLSKLGQVEQRGLLQAVLDVDGIPIRIACTHLDAGREDRERLYQTQQIKELLRRGDEPLLLGGDFNATPQSAVHRELQEAWIDLWPLVGEGEGHTIPVPIGTRRIDYIWIEPASILRPMRAWVPRTLASDHLPVVVEFKLVP